MVKIVRRIKRRLDQVHEENCDRIADKILDGIQKLLLQRADKKTYPIMEGVSDDARD